MDIEEIYTFLNLTGVTSNFTSFYTEFFGTNGLATIYYDTATNANALAN